jgi:hypothetical protein
MQRQKGDPARNVERLEREIEQANDERDFFREQAKEDSTANSSTARTRQSIRFSNVTARPTF